MELQQHYDNLVLDHDGDWLTIWFDRPRSRNALSAALVEELRAVLAAIAGERSLRGVTLRGKGGVFCAGGDLKDFKSVFQGEQADPAAVARANRAGGELFDQLNELPQLLLVLVEGAAMAGGLGIVCCADVVAVTADARFAISETSLGIPPAQIAPFVAERLGLRNARRLMLTGARFQGEEAQALGLADYVAADAAGLAAIEADIRRQLRRCAPGANAETKQILLASRRLDRPAMIERAAEGFARCLLGEEGREGIAAFVEKRQPRWAEADSNTGPSA